MSSIEDEIRAKEERIAELEAEIAANEARAVEAEANYRPPASADGGEGQDSPARTRDPGQAFNDMIREARYPYAARPWWLP